MYDHLQVSDIIYSNTLARAGVKANLLQWLMPWLDMNQRALILELKGFPFFPKLYFDMDIIYMHIIYLEYVSTTTPR